VFNRGRGYRRFAAYHTPKGFVTIMIAPHR
jgi:hypothetical protein